MKACNVKKADTFLVSRIPSWKLFSRLEHLCIKRAILGMIPLKALKGFRRRLRNQLPRQEKRRVPMYMSQPITESSNPNLARALQYLIPFHTVNSLPAATESMPGSQDHQKLLPNGWSKQTHPQKTESPKKSLYSPVPMHAGQTEGNGVVQSFILSVFSRWSSTYFFLTFSKNLFQWYQ